MKSFVAFIFTLYLIQNACAYCVNRDPWMLLPPPCYEIVNPCVNIGYSYNYGYPSGCGCVDPSPCSCGSPFVDRSCNCNYKSSCDCGSPINCGSSCNCGSPCNCGCGYSDSSCACGTACGCYRDPCNVCDVCEKPSPVCQCLNQCGNGCGCSYNGPIYFPEVQYPATIMDISPFYAGSCWNY